MVTENINIDVRPGGIPIVIHVTQYEVGLRQFVFTPYTSNGTQTVVAGSATLEGTKPDGYAFQQACEMVDGVITYTLQEQLCAVEGRVWSRLVIRDTNGGMIGYTAIVWVVGCAGVKDGAVMSDSDISALRQFLDEFGDIDAYRGALNGALAAVGGPLVAATTSAMTDRTKVYVYTGSETGYTEGHWYYWSGSAWTDGGVYQSTGINTDTTLTVAGMAADAKATGDAVTDITTKYVGFKRYLTANDDCFALPPGIYGIATSAASKPSNLPQDFTTDRNGYLVVFNTDNGVTKFAFVVNAYEKRIWARTAYEWVELAKLDVVSALINSAVNGVTLELNNLKGCFDFDFQYFDTNEFMVSKYWKNTSGTISLLDVASESYAAYPETELKAGTYYANNIPSSLAFIKGKTSGVVANLSSVASGNTFTIEEDSYLYYTAYLSASRPPLNALMLANAPLPESYVFGSYNTQLTFSAFNGMEQLNSGRNILVVGAGATYNTITAACADAVDDDIIFVLPGIYTEQISIWGKKLHIIGFDRKLCTIIDHHANYDTPPVEMNIGTLANFTIIEDGTEPDPDLPVEKDHLAYCIHNDSNANVVGQTLEIINCDMVNEIHACIGFGLYQDYTVTIRNCTMRSNAVKAQTYKRGALYFHANSGTAVTGQKMIVENCIASSADEIAVHVGMPGTGEMTYRLNGNQFWSDTNGTSDNAAYVSDNASLILDGGSSGNSIPKFNNMTPTQGSKNAITLNASSSGVVNNRKNRIVSGGVYEFCVVSEDRTSYDIGILKWDADGVLVVEQKNVLCNVSFSTSNGDFRVWNRDSANQHTYSVSIKPF